VTHIAVVAYPQLTDADQRWIESVRDRHDPQAGRVGVHLTIVFPCASDIDAVTTELAAAAEAAGRLEFEIVRAEAVPDALGEGAHVFLVPDAPAADAIAALHDRLHDGALRPHFRRDIPFLPHMTVAAKPDTRECSALADELIARCRGIRGRIIAIDLVDTDSTPVATLRRFLLSGPHFPT